MIKSITKLDFNCFVLLERISCIIAGRYGHEGYQVEAMIEDLVMKQLPILPIRFLVSSMVLHDEAILLLGRQKCLQLNHGTWKKHSTLNQERLRHSAVTTKTGIFVFGGTLTRNTFEYLPKGSTTWHKGKKKIPGGFDGGCVIAVKSDQEIRLIGGIQTENRILSFNVKDHTFKELPFQLNIGRSGHNCAFIPNTKKVMITGGHSIAGDFNSTEILDTEDGCVNMANPMNSERRCHGMGVLTINGEERVAVFGGFVVHNNIDTIELYNAKTEKWETSDIKLNTIIHGYLTVKLSDIISELQCNSN